MGELVVAAVPLGNIGDASERLKDAIRSADIVAAEDSRRFLRLCHDLNIECKAKVISFFEGNEIRRLDELAELLSGSSSVLLVSDAGMPTVSDPGYRAIRLAIDKGFPVRVIPGPSAVVMALALSGLPTDRFTFDGFPPRTEGARKAFFESLATEERTMVFFEAPHRITAFLRDAREIFGPTRLASLSREMTKIYEETVRGTLDDLLTWSESKEMLGEFTIVISGFDRSSITFSDDEIAERVIAHESLGVTRKEAIAAIAKELHLPKRRVFDIMVASKASSE